MSISLPRACLQRWISGYVARKRTLPSDCKACNDACLVTRESVLHQLPAEAYTQLDIGGRLLYPPVSLYSLLIQTLEDRLTRVFSTKWLHTKVVKDFLLLAANVRQIGCSEHSTALTGSVARFYCITQVHFLLKGLNQCATHKKSQEGLALWFVKMWCSAMTVLLAINLH